MVVLARGLVRGDLTSFSCAPWILYRPQLRQIRCTQVPDMRVAYRVAVSVVGLAGTVASLGSERRYRHEAIPTLDRRRRAHPGDATDGTRRDRLMERRGGGRPPVFFLAGGGGFGGFPPPRGGKPPTGGGGGGRPHTPR